MRTSSEKWLVDQCRNDVDLMVSTNQRRIDQHRFNIDRRVIFLWDTQRTGIKMLVRSLPFCEFVCLRWLITFDDGFHIVVWITQHCQLKLEIGRSNWGKKIRIKSEHSQRDKIFDTAHELSSDNCTLFSFAACQPHMYTCRHCAFMFIYVCICVCIDIYIATRRRLLGKLRCFPRCDIVV